MKAKRNEKHFEQEVDLQLLNKLEIDERTHQTLNNYEMSEI